MASVIIEGENVTPRLYIDQQLSDLQIGFVISYCSAHFAALEYYGPNYDPVGQDQVLGCIMKT